MKTGTRSLRLRTFSSLAASSSAQKASTSVSDRSEGQGSDSKSDKRPIYVAATRQHVGKTTTSLALVQGLQKRFEKVGFMKPVGQQSLTVWEEEIEKQVQVDKDVVVVKKHFKLDHLPYGAMSPVLIPSGYTKDYIDGKITLQSQKELIENAYSCISQRSSVVLCEGTGHSAVGSIVGAGNAEVASWVGADMVLVANGGLGSTFDELELNRVFCEHHNVSIAGVVVNKVKVEKYDETKYYLDKALMSNWGIPLIGCIPDRPFLGCPALADLERLFGGSFLSGQAHELRHYTMSDIFLVATSLCEFLNSLRTRPTRTLYVCHASRDDILLGFIGEYQRRKMRGEEIESALLVCEGQKLDPHIVDMLSLDLDPPILVVPQDAQKVMQQINSFTPKLNAFDTTRVGTAVEHYESYIDFDLLLQKTGNMPDEDQIEVAN
eukprot:CAMPEP_0194217770 /NCGR_PEP_ID=MMETSP0156-20130528/22241_1 /TAXON_ID=33649 /ORGANISM="Thalassionema nitzschioides, Strain L26-B" /LENGTH=434 /DNA_ID=CAMNT_0038946903 /DNA_START=118 /DNA_END=1422 /DNA_ORIENTATION=-